MRHLILALVVTVVGFSKVHAAPAKTSPFSNKSFGDGNGYKHPDADVGQYFEIKPERPAELKPESPRIPAKVTHEIKPAVAIPSRPRPRPFAPAVVKAEEPAKKMSLPTAPPVAPVLGADAENGALDSASEDARRDYEARLFGAAPAPRRPGFDDPKAAHLTDPVRTGSMGEGMLFVSLELDSQEAGALRDAVAGLGATAAFRPDARFQPMPGAAGLVRISGWLPASRLGDAITRPGVRRVEVERGSRPAADSRITGDYLLTLRVTDTAFTQESIAASVRELTAETGYKLDRVVAIEAQPGGGATALVSGTMPVSQLARALGLPGVIKIISALPATATSAPVVPAAPAKKEGFLQFVMARSLWLVLLTALLALPAVGAAVKKGLAVFVPYR